MFYSFLADVVVAIHVAFVGFVIFGLLAILVGVICRWRWVRNFWFRAIHCLMIGIVVFEALSGIVCPLTTWEKSLRTQAGDEAVYCGSFIGNCMHEVLFYEAPEWVFTTSYCVFGAMVLLTFLLAPPRWPWRTPSRE